MYIAIEGVIGVGKTTLARLLQPRFDAELQLEVFEENPFLADFYGDRQRYAFQTQIFFLLSRYHQQRSYGPDVLDQGRNLITDYTFAKDALFASINISGDELEMYYRVHEALGEKVPTPDLVIYLQASTPVLMGRIAMRDRPYERNMEADYIERLNGAYEEFFEKTTPGRAVLKVETDNINIVANQEHLKLIAERVRQALQMAPYQSELPLTVSQDNEV